MLKHESVYECIAIPHLYQKWKNVLFHIQGWFPPLYEFTCMCNKILNIASVKLKVDNFRKRIVWFQGFATMGNMIMNIRNCGEMKPSLYKCW